MLKIIKYYGILRTLKGTLQNWQETKFVKITDLQKKLTRSNDDGIVENIP